MPCPALQDPLPERSSLARRVFAMTSAAGLGLLVWRIVEVLAERAFTEPREAILALTNIAQGLILLLILDRALYLVAPSPGELNQMLKTLIGGWRARAK